MTPKPFADPAVARAFAAYPPAIRSKLMALRALIFRTAAATDGVGALEETLKWGEPAYVTSQSKSGSTIRIDWKLSCPSEYAMYFHCQTNLVATFRKAFPRELAFEGNRAIVFAASGPIPTSAVSSCVAAALTYHRTKRRRRMSRPRTLGSR